jgi:hypothetical protein
VLAFDRPGQQVGGADRIGPNRFNMRAAVDAEDHLPVFRPPFQPMLETGNLCRVGQIEVDDGEFAGRRVRKAVDVKALGLEIGSQPCLELARPFDRA